MMVRIAPTPSSRVNFSSLRECTMPGAFRKRSGAFEISQMSAWRVMAQKGG